MEEAANQGENEQYVKWKEGEEAKAPCTYRDRILFGVPLREGGGKPILPSGGAC